MVAATVAEVLAVAETAIHGLPGGPPAIAAAIRAVIWSSDVARTASMVCLERGVGSERRAAPVLSPILRAAHRKIERGWTQGYRGRVDSRGILAARVR